ncbi:DUF6174 domain-containing protein [Lolliginicoccus suaedae]|uniref:DUF6174 domain-containing protein n=1 Tax=Lolliginicoccus suaedae TaxID=2605429 RepID=UPI0011ED36ED|nr:DUF6174 domain-containing protein [Lolliginicoccus suaedae]
MRIPMTVIPIAASAATAMLIVASCGSAGPEQAVPGTTTPPGDPTTLEQARALWTEQRPDKYQFTLSTTCYCPEAMIAPRTITVEGDTATVIEPPWDEQWTIHPRDTTIDALLDSLEGVLATADSVEATFDPERGFPSSVEIDSEVNALDDEMAYTITLFEPITE